jgi:hypothetical protein
MIICFKVVFNLVLSNRKTHLIVKSETFPHLRRARAGFGWGRGAVCPPPNIRREARSHKRYRLSFFNSADGIKLRLSVGGHDTNHSDTERHCALCGNFGQSGSWRGHISSFCFPSCDVHLCVRLHYGLRKNCWTLWNSQGRLEPRVTTRPGRESDNDDGAEADTNRSVGTIRTASQIQSEGSRTRSKKRTRNAGKTSQERTN